MKKSSLPLRPCALLVAWLMAGAAQAQVSFSGDSTPTGNMGMSYSAADVTVGNTRPGTLEVAAGATLSTTGLVNLAMVWDIAGTANVSGNSRWNAKDLVVGKMGRGFLNITNGSQATSATAVISEGPMSAGVVTVDGANSTWTLPANAASSLVLAKNAGAGSIVVSNGGAVNNGQTVSASLDNGGSSSSIQISGNNSSMTSLACYLGEAGDSNIRVDQGGLMECKDASRLTFGAITVADADSLLLIGAGLDIGASDKMPVSQTNLSVTEGGRVVVKDEIRLPFVTNAADQNTWASIFVLGAVPGTIDAKGILFGANASGSISFYHTDNSGNYQFPTPVSGPGTVNVMPYAGSEIGFTTMTGNNTYSGKTNVEAGTLRAGADTGLSANSDFVVASGATLDTNTFNARINSLENSGTVTMAAGGTTGSLTVAQNYSSNGGKLVLNTRLGDSNSPTEKLVVGGDTSGDTILDITNLGGTGAPSTGNGILVVEVAGASNGTFRLPAPGYLQAGTYRYDLVKTGNNWYLVSEARAESAPAVGVVCTPAELSDAAAETATCKVTLSAALTTDLGVNLTLPATSGRYTTTCTSPIVIAANATEASCTITSVPNNTANDGDVTATLAIAPPTVADAYTVNGPAAQVLIKDKDKTGGDNGGGDNGGGNGGGDNGGGTGGGDNGGGGGGDNGGGTAVPHKVPTMGAVGLMAMASVLGLLGVRRTRQSGTPQSGTRRTPGTSA